MAEEASLYHVTPLHYLPPILQGGALYAQSVLASRGIAPRATARRRDKTLGLSDYIHLSLRSHTPLLADKMRKGYPHVLLAFDRSWTMALPQVALLPYSTKAWQTRAAYVPVTEPCAQERLLRRHEENGRYRNLEVLVKYGMGLDGLRQIVFPDDLDRQLVVTLLDGLQIAAAAPLITDASQFPHGVAYRPTTRDAVAAHFEACLRAQALLPPPELPFD
jgi:hypothetical protein